MSRQDLKDLGEHLDAGTAGLLVVAAVDLADRVAQSLKAAEQVVRKELKANEEQLRKDLDAAKKQAS